MGIEAVTRANREDFLAYCRLHRFDHDESYLSDHDLASFDPEGPEDRAFIERDGEGRPRAAAALMLRPALLEQGKARFRILHVEAGGRPPGEVEEVYAELVSRLAPCAAGLEWIYLFLPEGLAAPTEAVRRSGFSQERKAWLLEKDLAEAEEPLLPQGFRLREARLMDGEGRPGPDAETWCGIVNASFAALAGHTELSPERLVADIDPALLFPSSWILLEEEGRAVGLCSTIRDIEEEGSAFLGPVAVLPEYQGRGLGRASLRGGLAAAKAAGFRRCLLSVNAENDGAVRLYLSEGFTRKLVMVAWHRRP